MRRPTDTLCPVCGTVFQQPVRPQGGGKRTIYCAPKCRSLDWARGNAAKRKATILKYESKPENKERKRERTRKATLAKYGLSDLEFGQMLDRQTGRCLGCGQYIDRGTARIDHDHETGKVRGLLCDGCNWTLGHARDNREHLYRLAAYLELDRSKPVIYVIGSLRNDQIVPVANSIRELGIEVVDNWFAAGKIADDAWRDYSKARGRTYAEALESREANHVYYFDKAYIALSDAVVLVYPAGKSAHLEFGWAIGQGKRGYVLLDDTPDRFDVMLQFATATVYYNIADLLAALRSDFTVKE
jgi:hypothetical protein